jgi:hypothetical protein
MHRTFVNSRVLLASALAPGAGGENGSFGAAAIPQPLFDCHQPLPDTTAPVPYSATSHWTAPL